MNIHAEYTMPYEYSWPTREFNEPARAGAPSLAAISRGSTGGGGDGAGEGVANVHHTFHTALNRAERIRSHLKLPRLT